MIRKKDKQTWRDGEFLTTARNTLEADILESKLASEGIPCIKRYTGAGNAMEIIMGSDNSYPIDLYVPKDALEDAKNIIIPFAIVSDDFDEDATIVIEEEIER